MKRIAAGIGFVLVIATQSAGFGAVTASAETATEYCAAPVDIDTPDYVNFCCTEFLANRLAAIPIIEQRWGTRCRG